MMKQHFLFTALISLCIFQAVWSAASGRAIPLPLSVLRKHGAADCMVPLEEMGPCIPDVVSILERKPRENKKSLFVEMPLSGAVVGLYVLYKGAGTLQEDLRQQDIVLTQCKDNTSETAELCIETFMPLFRPHKREIEKVIGLFFYPYDAEASPCPRRKGYSEDLGRRPLVVSKLMNAIINLDVSYGFFKQDTSRIPVRSDGLPLCTPKSGSAHHKHIEVILSYPWMSCVHSYWNLHRKIWFADLRSSDVLNKRRRPR
jgi:hypothetical protein